MNELTPETGMQMNFGMALGALKQGRKVARIGWNGKGLWLELQRPDAHSKMTLPYLFMCYPDDAQNTPGARVPWLASQTDMLAEDWFVLVEASAVNAAAEPAPVDKINPEKTTEPTPTIGRRIWYYPRATDSAMTTLDRNMPMDAGIVYVHGDGKVNLLVTDHLGNTFARKYVPIIPQGRMCDSLAGYARWMPYQVKTETDCQERDVVAQPATSNSCSDSAYIVSLFTGASAGCQPKSTHDTAAADVASPKLGNNAVGKAHIAELMSRVTYICPNRIGNLTSTFVHAFLDGKFYLGTGHSACVDPVNYDHKRGRNIAFSHAREAAEDKLWELEGYALFKNLQ